MNRHLKQLLKKHRKQLYQNYITKKNDTGYRYPNCPMCFSKNKELIQSTYNEDDGYWYCNNCKEKWSVVA